MSNSEVIKGIKALSDVLEKMDVMANKMVGLRSKTANSINRTELEINAARITVTDMRYYSATAMSTVEHYVDVLKHIKYKTHTGRVNMHMLQVNAMYDQIKVINRVLNDGLDTIDRALSHRLCFVDSPELENLRELQTSIEDEEKAFVAS